MPSTDTTFGLRNKNGSCWINAALQAVFRIPELQTRFNENEEDDANPVEVCLSEIWSSSGEEGLKSFYECVKTSTMPAGEGIGDSHELIEFLCDKISFLDKLFRFKVAHVVSCDHCDFRETRHDSLVEFSVTPSSRKQTMASAIGDAVRPVSIPDWTCEVCKKKGCTKQLLLTDFPQVMMLHQTSIGTTTTYTPVLIVNKIRYVLLAVVCFTGGHWFTWGRNVPPGQPWYRLDDEHVQSNSGNFMPQDDRMRLLMYYRMNE
jgi:ubiquitin C-terminal hydrolase